MKNRIFLFLILSLTLFKIVFGYEQTIEFSKKNIQVKLTSCLARTHFEIQANFSNETDLNKLWLGIIISTQIESYDGSNFVYCYRTNTSESVQQRYFDSENYNYTLFSNEFIGLNSLSVIKNENKVTCKFTRENSNVDYNYLNFDLNTFYIAADYGKYENKIPEFVNNTFDMVETVSITYNTDCEDYTTLDNENIFIKFRNLGAKTWYEATAVISKNISLDNIWFGVGINFNRKMPNANVVICKRNSTYNSVEHYYNEGLQPKYIDETNKFIGLSSTYLSVTNRSITCRFMRDNNNANSKYIYQNGENLYVLAAYGPFSNDIMSIHSLVKESKNIVSFPIRPVDEYFITLDNEKINVTFKNCGSMTHFKVTALIENGVSIDNAWLGLGFNINNKMPGASVVVCKQGINLTAVEHYYNNGLNPEYLNSSNKFEGLSSVSVKIDGSFMICKFSRDNSNKNSKYMNLNTQKIFLSVAYGSLQKENILAHKKVVVSKNIVTFPVIPQCRRFTTLDNERIIVYYENLCDRTNFEVQAEINYISSWIALGFRDEAFTTYSLVMCKYNSTFNSVEHYSFDGQNLTYFNQSNIYAGLSNPIVSVSEKMISCLFTRDNFDPNRNYTYINNNNNLYLMVAYGPFINNDVSNYEVMVETLNEIEFPIENLLPEFNKTILNNGKIKVDYKNCGSYTHFEINALIENNIDLNNFWISLALNNRRDLINSNAVICRYQLDSYSIEHYYYNGSQPKLMNISQALRSTYLNVESSTRLVSCKFTRENTNPNNMYFNLNTEKLYIIVSYGKLNKQDILDPSALYATNNFVSFPVQEKCDEYLTFNNELYRVDFKNYGSQTDFIVNLDTIFMDNFPDFIALIIGGNNYLNYVFCVDKDDIQSYFYGYSSYNQSEDIKLITNSNSSAFNLADLSYQLIDYRYQQCRFTRKNSANESFHVPTDKVTIGVGYGYLGSNVLNFSEFLLHPNAIEFPIKSNGSFQTITLGDYMLSWKEKVDEVEFIFKTKISLSKNVYSSFALSFDKNMGDDNVIVCMRYDNYYNIEHYYNTGKFRPTLLSPNEPSIGLKFKNIELNNGYLTCSFTRYKSHPNIQNYFDTRLNYYILFAKGSTNDFGLMGYHFGDKASTSEKINFLTPLVESNKQATLSTTKAPPKPKTKFELFEIYDFGNFELAIEDSTFYSRITLNQINNTKRQITQPNLGVDQYIAYAYSNDQQMGSDSVVVCKVFNNTGSVEHYYNNGKSQPVLLDPKNPTIGLSETSVNVVNGKINCSFVREKYIEGESRYFDVRKKSYVLIVWGRVLNGVIQFHGDNYSISDKELDFVPLKTSEPLATTKSLLNTTTNINKPNQYVKNEYSLNWIDDRNYTWFIFSTNVSLATNLYSSFAFSSDRSMGIDDVVVCKTYKNSSSIIRMYNPGKNNPILLDSTYPSIGLENMTINFNNGLLTCKFRRLKSKLNTANYYDLSKGNSYYLLFARGKTDDAGIIQYHSQDKTSSSETFDFSSTITSSTTMSSVSRTTKPITTVTSSGALSSRVANVEWKISEYYADMKFYEGSLSTTGRQSNLPATNRYIAFGLSSDDKMGNDCVIVCKISNGVGSVEHYYNTDKSAPGYLDPDNPTIGLTNAVVTVVNGQIQCSFTREKFIQGNSRYFDMRNTFTLLVVKGGVSNGVIQYHGTSDVTISDGKINFAVNGTYSSNELDLAKAKAHGILMVLAWMMCVPLAIVLSRYYKFLLPNFKILEVAFWFNAHRVLMIFTLIVSIIAFLVVLAQLDWKWVDAENNETAMAHSIFGIIVISISFLQIIMGLFRPDKDAKFRPVFNWTHRITGISLFILAIVSIYLGVCIKKMNLKSVGWGIFLGWNIWFVIYIGILEATPLIFPSPDKKEELEMQDSDSKAEPDEDQIKVEYIKIALLIIHIIMTLGFGIALMVVIGVADVGKFS